MPPLFERASTRRSNYHLFFVLLFAPILVYYKTSTPRYAARGGSNTDMSSDYLITFISLLFEVLSLAILGRVLMSWVDPQGNMRINQVLRDVTEPILAPIRNLMPNMAMFDFSPIIAMLLLQALRQLIVMALRGG
jgi:YggT family protein